MKSLILALILVLTLGTSASAAFPSPSPSLSPDATTFVALLTDNALQVQTIGEAITKWKSTNDALDEQKIEQAITEGIARLDRTGPLPCYYSWWADMRAAYDMLAFSLLASKTGHQDVSDTAFTASSYLLALATHDITTISC